MSHLFIGQAHKVNNKMSKEKIDTQQLVIAYKKNEKNRFDKAKKKSPEKISEAMYSIPNSLFGGKRATHYPCATHACRRYATAMPPYADSLERVLLRYRIGYHFIGHRGYKHKANNERCVDIFHVNCLLKNRPYPAIAEYFIIPARRLSQSTSSDLGGENNFNVNNR